MTASMQDYPCMKSYMTTLKNRAKRHRIPLKDAFLEAGVRDSTYYRAKQGKELRYETAKLVFDYITNASQKQTHQKKS
jgi:predicted transcriptional regulator